jgi:hypothetical protein
MRSVYSERFTTVIFLSALTVIGFKAVQYTCYPDTPSWKMASGIALWALAAGTVITWFMRKGLVPVLLLASVLLFALAVEVFVHKDYQIHNLIEHALQYGTPALLAILIWKGKAQAFTWTARILIALTFVGHGVYALGVMIESTNFMPMTGAILGTNAHNSELFLMAAGILDMVLAAAVLSGVGVKLIIWYAILWGLITAVARLYYFGYLGMEKGTWLKGATEMGYRLCHGLVPLAYWIHLRQRNN